MRLKLAVWLGLVFYTFLSVTDWMMTHALLRMHPGAVESNPLASACLELYGWNGLAFYKVGGVLVFVGAVFLLARRRPAVAAGVVAFGCAVLLWVTSYTHTLICEAHRESAEIAASATWSHLGPDLPPIDSSAQEQCWFPASK
jgi:hypothetical protein